MNSFIGRVLTEGPSCTLHPKTEIDSVLLHPAAPVNFPAIYTSTSKPHSDSAFAASRMEENAMSDLSAISSNVF